MTLADRHGALSLKSACIEHLFTGSGEEIVMSQDFEGLAPPLLLETFREYVSRRKTNLLCAGPRPDDDFESNDDSESDDDEPGPVEAPRAKRAKKGRAPGYKSGVRLGAI
jgi:hypothetical protein